MKNIKLLHRSGLLLAATAFCLSSSFVPVQAGQGPQPSVCVRSCWGARAPACQPGNISALTRAIVHHTAGAGDWTTDYETGKALVRAIQNGHIDGRGFCDIAYAFLVNAGGHIYEGRENAMAGLPKGYHDCCNNNSFGFNVMGYYHPPYNHTFTAASQNALMDVIAWRMPSSWSPYGSSVYCSRSVGTLDGHRSVVESCGPTACPGDTIWAYMGAIRDGVNARKSLPTVSPNPAICSRSTGKIDIFGLASDGTTLQIRSWDGAVWSPWYGMGTGFTSGAGAASRSPGWLDVVCRKADSAYYLNTWNGSVWSGFYSIGGSFSSMPAICSRSPGKIDVFGLASDGTTLQIKSWDGAAWSPWYGLGNGFTSGPAVTSRSSGWIDVVARKGDNAYYLNTWTNTGWSGFYSIGGSFSSTPAICSRSSGAIDVFGLASDNTTVQIRTWNGSTWGVWYGLGSGFTSGPAAASRSTGMLDVVARGGDATYRLNTWSGTAWSGWYSIGGSFK